MPGVYSPGGLLLIGIGVAVIHPIFMRPVTDNVAVNSGNLADDCRIGVFSHVLCNLAIKSQFFELLRGINYDDGFKIFVPCFPAFG